MVTITDAGPYLSTSPSEASRGEIADIDVDAARLGDLGEVCGRIDADRLAAELVAGESSRPSLQPISTIRPGLAFSFRTSASPPKCVCISVAPDGT